jgi:hypothetical protein
VDGIEEGDKGEESGNVSGKLFDRDNVLCVFVDIRWNCRIARTLNKKKY